MTSRVGASQILLHWNDVWFRLVGLSMGRNGQYMVDVGFFFSGKAVGFEMS